MRVDVDSSIGYALKRAATALRSAMDAELRAHDLSVSQYSCLELLAREPGMSTTALARGAFVTRQAMHQLLEGLRSSGLVQGDGRAWGQRLSLTPAGEARLAGASHAVALVEERMIAGLDARGRERLLGDLLACVTALEDAPAGEAGT